MFASRIAVFCCLPMVAGLLLTTPTPTQAQAQADRTFSSLEERMTGREFRETGLYKLDDEELAALNRWIRERSLTQEAPRGESPAADTPPADAPSDRRGFLDRGSNEPIRSRIAGPFTGWDGETEFVLENGMVWRQSQAGTFHVREIDSPEVEIRPGALGSWQLIVEGYNRRVRVERIE